MTSSRQGFKPGHPGNGNLIRVKGGVLQKLRPLGIQGENEALRIALLALIGARQQAIDTLPVGSVARGIVEGAGAASVKMAMALLEEA